MVNSEQSDSYKNSFLLTKLPDWVTQSSYRNIPSESGWIVHMDRWMQCWLGWTVAQNWGGITWPEMQTDFASDDFFGCQMTPWIGVASVGYVHLHAFTIVYQNCAGTSHNGLVPTVREWQDMHHGGHVSYRHAASETPQVKTRFWMRSHKFLVSRWLASSWWTLWFLQTPRRWRHQPHAMAMAWQGTWDHQKVHRCPRSKLSARWVALKTMLPSHFGWPHSTQPRRVSSVLTCLYRYCKGSASSGMTIPDSSCFIFSRFAAADSLCRIVVRMRHRFLWSPMKLAWMYYMILYDIICCMYPNIGNNCLRGCIHDIHAWQMYTTFLHTITRSHQQEAYLARGCAQWTKHAVGDRRAGTAGTSDDSPSRPCRDWCAQLHDIACIRALCI